MSIANTYTIFSVFCTYKIDFKKDKFIHATSFNIDEVMKLLVATEMMKSNI